MGYLKTRLTRRERALWLALVLALALVPVVAIGLPKGSTPSLQADLILYNGKITVLGGEPTTVQAIAIRGGDVLALGASGQLLNKYAGPTTERVDLHGRRVLPGLIDAHLHGLRNGYHCFTQTVRLDLVTSRTQALADYTAKAQALSDDTWVWTTSGGWHVNQLDVPGMFTIAELDAAVPDNPLWVQASGFNGTQVNSKALEVLGLSAGDTGVEVDPGTGLPTGRLTAPANGAANAAVLAQLDARTIEQQAECLSDFIETSNGLGLTAWNDPDGNTFPWVVGGGEFSQGLHGHQPVIQLHRSGELDARVTFHLSANYAGLEQALADTRNAMGFVGDDMLRYMGVGEEVYPGAYVDYEVLTTHLAANRLSFEHHTTDTSIDEQLAGFEAANEVYPIADLVWSLAHPGNGLPTDEQIARSIALGVGWSATIAPIKNGATGPRFRTLMESGARMCIITDAMNVAPWAPFQKLWYVISGDTLLPGVSGVPEDQQLTRTEALRHSTEECAWFLDQEGRLGTLEVGTHADLIVLTDDYFTVPEEDIKDLESVLTVVDGRVVYADGPYASLED